MVFGNFHMNRGEGGHKLVKCMFFKKKWLVSIIIQKYGVLEIILEVQKQTEINEEEHY